MEQTLLIKKGFRCGYAHGLSVKKCREPFCLLFKKIVNITTLLGDENNMRAKVLDVWIENYVFCVIVNVNWNRTHYQWGNSGHTRKMPRTGKDRDTQKDKKAQQKETQREKECLHDDEESYTNLKDLFSRLIKKVDESLSARLTALERKVDEALTGELKQMNESLQINEDRLADRTGKTTEWSY